MKIAISATGDNLGAEIDPAFGRCSNFIIYDTDTDTHTVIANRGSAMAGGAGTSAARMILEQGVTEIITGKVGLKSRPILERAGVAIRENQSGSIAQVISGLKAGPGAGIPATEQAPASDQRPGPSKNNPAGYCYCQNCGQQYAGDPEVPCFKQRCPQCNSGLERRYR
jgi:predicted Fe-Mo cluster-binding NifX family protein